MQYNINKKKALQLFELNDNYNLMDLKRAFKRVVLKYHPDKTMKVSDTPLFQQLTELYSLLTKDYDARVNNKQHFDLKTDYEKTNAKTPRETHKDKITGSFDVKLFNKLFNQHKIKDVYDDGYHDWQNQTVVNDNIIKTPNNHALVKYKEPEPMLSTVDPFYELGKKQVDDFGQRMNLAGVQYSDYKVAHTTEKIIDPSVVKTRKIYKDVDELQKDRSKLKTEMSSKELKRYIRQQEQQEKKEEERLAHLKLRDEVIFQNYSKTHNLLTK